jgi:thioredoxin 1
MVENLTTEQFKEYIFDYTVDSEWNGRNSKPTVVDLYAPWCAPCKGLAPILDELSEEYTEINFYKVDIDKEHEVAGALGVRSIPTLIFIPMEGDPSVVQGAIDKEKFVEAFKTVFGI